MDAFLWTSCCQLFSFLLCFALAFFFFFPMTKSYLKRNGSDFPPPSIQGLVVAKEACPSLLKSHQDLTQPSSQTVLWQVLQEEGETNSLGKEIFALVSSTSTHLICHLKN